MSLNTSFNSHPEHSGVSRKAVLIGCHGKDKVPLHGIEIDLVNMRKFLRSDFGGAWFNDEITTLYEATADNVTEALKNCAVDYLLVYYTGHGHTDASNNRMLSLEDKDVMDNFMLARCPRQMLILDSCRYHTGETVTGFQCSPGLLETNTNYNARYLFDELIRYSPWGKTIIYGAEDGELAYDNRQGGFFTQALLHAAIHHIGDDSIHSLDYLLGEVELSLRINGINQAPSIVYKRGNLKVPFALNQSSFTQFESDFNQYQRKLLSWPGTKF